MHESMGETCKNESLADDNTTLMLLEEDGLAASRKNLDEFGKISGLLCNFDKTVVMPIGRNTSAPKNLFGFKCENKIKLLGMEVTNMLDNTDDIFIEIGEKILNLILFWSRFRLSLPGRIAIVKTLLIPQLNYVGCILTPSRLVIDNLQQMLDDFALDGLRVSKDRYYLPPTEGGIGLLHIGTFLMSQKCSLIKRAHANCIDNWRLRLRALSPCSDVTLLQSIDINRHRNPILYNIVEAYELFVRCYGSSGNNLLVMPIFFFSNTAICRSRFDKKLLDLDFFGKNFYYTHRNEIRKLTISDCYNGNSFKSMDDFREMNLPFNMVTWMALRSAIILAKKISLIWKLPPDHWISSFPELKKVPRLSAT